jgi:hypothetical protein
MFSCNQISLIETHTPLPGYKNHVLTRKSAGELRFRGPKCGGSALVCLSSSHSLLWDCGQMTSAYHRPKVMDQWHVQFNHPGRQR